MCCGCPLDVAVDFDETHKKMAAPGSRSLQWWQKSSSYSMFYHIILCYVILYYFILYFIMFYCFLFFILYYIILYYIILFYFILYYLLCIIFFVILYYFILYYIISYICYICILYTHIAAWMRENQHNRRWKLCQSCQVMRCQALQALKRQWTRWEAYFFISQNSKLDVWVFINLCVKWNIDIAVWTSIRNSNTKITFSMIPRSPRDVFHLRNWTQIVLLSLQNRDIFIVNSAKSPSSPIDPDSLSRTQG